MFHPTFYNGNADGTAFPSLCHKPPDCDGVMENADGTALEDFSHGDPGCENLDLLAEVWVAVITKKRKRLSKHASAVLKERFKMKTKIDRVCIFFII